MSASRRLDRIEADLPPREAVLHWLGEVHRSGSLDVYLASLLEQPGAMSPLVAIPERVRAAARGAHAGAPRAVIRDAERRAAMDVVFLLELIVELERVGAGIIDRGTLRLAALHWEMRARTGEGGNDRRGWASWRRGVLDLAIELAQAELARRLLEDRYLDGRATRSPVTGAAWDELSGDVTALVSTMPSLPGGRRRRRPDRAVAAAAERTAPDEAARIVEHARARTLDLLGDHATARAIIERAAGEGLTEVDQHEGPRTRARDASCVPSRSVGQHP